MKTKRSLPLVTNNNAHIPVLYHEIISGLNPKSPGYYVDATVGAGGHAWGILDKSSPSGKLLGLDVDPDALKLARQRLLPFGQRVVLVLASYTNLSKQINALGWDEIQGIVIDLGVSSMQINTPERGFSFQAEGPLDMRFSQESEVTAAEIINKYTPNDLANIFWKFGEERMAHKIANEIFKHRPINTTTQLAELIRKTVGGKWQKVHPATRVFQALRIAVNNELENLRSLLPDALRILAPGGRIAIISFHSLEDRIVKQFFKLESSDCICPPKSPMCTCNHKASIRLITHKPIKANADQIFTNPRSRSAHLRIAEKLALA